MTCISTAVHYHMLSLSLGCFSSNVSTYNTVQYLKIWIHLYAFNLCLTIFSSYRGWKVPEFCLWPWSLIPWIIFHFLYQILYHPLSFNISQSPLTVSLSANDFLSLSWFILAISIEQKDKKSDPFQGKSRNNTRMSHTSKINNAMGKAPIHWAHWY